jgi:hypothetical protein
MNLIFICMGTGDLKSPRTVVLVVRFYLGVTVLLKKCNAGQMGLCSCTVVSKMYYNLKLVNCFLYFIQIFLI